MRNRWNVFLRKFGIALFLSVYSWVAIASQAQVPVPLYLRYEERYLLSYLLAGVGRSEPEKKALAGRLSAYMKEYLSRPSEEIQVSSFDEYLREFRGPWPNSYSVLSDIDLIEHGDRRGPRVIKAKSPELALQIAAYEQFRIAELGNRLGPLVAGALVKGAQGKWSAIQRVDDSVLAVYREAEAQVEQEFRMIESIGAEISNSDRFKGLGIEMKVLMTTIFSNYFGKMSLESKTHVVGKLLGENLFADPIQKFELMVLSGGPQFQKLLQVVAREGNLSEDLLEVFRKLESKASPIPAAIVRNLFEAERAIYKWVDYDLKPLGTGTMAQVHRGRMRTSMGVEDVVIRFLKPDIARRVSEDHKILSEIAPILDANPIMRERGFPRLVPVVSDLTRTVQEELSLEATIDRQIKGRQVYSQKLFYNDGSYKNDLIISVPKVYILDHRSILMVQELVDGDKLDKVAETWSGALPAFKKTLIEEIAKVWVEEVFFKSGFFHADLHQGNFMVDVTDERIKASILDFGMGGTISRDLQRQILNLGAAVELNKADSIANLYWVISDKARNQIGLEEFRTRVQRQVQSMQQGLSPIWGFHRWSSWAMDQGIQFPYEFVGLNRGAVILDKLLKDSGSNLTMSTLSKKLATKYPNRVWNDLRQEKEITTKDMMRLGWIAFIGHTTADDLFVAPSTPLSAPRINKCSAVMMPQGAL